MLNKHIKHGLDILKKFFKQFYDIFFYKKDKNYKKILVLGGYGYKNVGDEAQLSATLDHLYEKFPDHMIKVLTPNPYYTYTEHNKCLVGEAPRTAFYEQDTSPLYNLSSVFLKPIFLFISCLVYLNAFLTRAGLPTILINARKATLLEDIKTSDLVFYAGGGYLTGKTLSRLWDGAFFIRIADVFRVPTVLSGQTIGVWNGNFNKNLAKWGLSKAKVITVRDPEDSLKALDEIGLKGDNFFVTFDDALFCQKLDNYKKPADKDYIALNIHYWGLKTQKEKQDLLVRINNVTEIILSKTAYSIVLIPMHPSDEETMEDFIQKYGSDRVSKFNYEYNFREIRSVISQANVCVTMKHHPIIFAVGEKVPVVSLSMGDYYEHKNIGALKIFGLEKYNVKFEKDNYINEFEDLFTETLQRREQTINHLDIKFLELKAKKERFLTLTKEITLKD